MIEISGLNKTYAVGTAGEHHVLHDINLSIADGDVFGIIGASGAGKSTLVNGLVGAAVLGTGAVRARDDTGRHTTVARRMIAVPGAGVIVDAPGLRSLPLLDESDGLAATFPDIAAHLGGCRFRDCTHGDEPGCAVRAAVRAGEIPEERLAEYRALEAEMLRNRRGLDPAAPQSLTS